MLDELVDNQNRETTSKLIILMIPLNNKLTISIAVKQDFYHCTFASHLALNRADFIGLCKGQFTAPT